MAALAVALVSCTGRRVKSERVITVTIEPLRYFTEQIAGDRFKVVTMVPVGGNPETYEPSARQMMDLSQSDMYVKVGSIGFERTWMKRLEANAPHAIVVDSSEGIGMISTGHGYDPHTWMSTSNARVIARNIYSALVSIDARDSVYFRENLERLYTRIASVDTYIRSRITSGTPSAFLVYHPVLTYYARDFGLRQIAIEEEGHEPSAAQLQHVISTARDAGVRTFLVQREFTNSNIAVVAKAVGTRKATINPLGYQWNKEMKAVAELLR